MADTRNGITPIVMPKWGLSMQEGTVVEWRVEEGAAITVGMPLLDVETDKIANAVEATDPGVLRRKVARPGQTLPVKALLGVMADASVSDAEIDAYIASYQVPAADDDDDEGAAPAWAWSEVQGIRVRHARRGPDTGVPVLFLHGFGGDLDNWLFNLDAVAERHPVIALDLPAHGQSDARLPGTSLAALAGFVAAFLDAQGVQSVHAVGHSMGGAIAARLALDHPGRVTSVTLIGSAGLGEEINAGYIQGFVGAASRRELKPVVEQLFADPGLVSRQLLDDLLRYKRLDGVGEALAALGEALFGGGRQSALPATQLPQGLPVLVIWGEQDRIIPAAHATRAPAGAAVHVIPGAGHMVQMEQSAQVNALLLAHLGGTGP